jgi:aminoglycoside phosphotransferase (APT) family kinase protein
MTRVHGGLLNRMYRLDTDLGSFAVKELNLDRDWTYHVGDGFRLERAAYGAGIPMPEPISAGHDALVHRWIDGAKVPNEPVSVAMAHELGGILACIHRLDVAWPTRTNDKPMPKDWPELAGRARTTGQPWADELTAQVETFLAIARFVDDAGRPRPTVLSHRDINQKNLLSRDGRPIILDWEAAGEVPLACELGATALNLAKGDSFDRFQPPVFRAVLDGYIDGGGALPPSGPAWFADVVGGWTWFTRWNILRCLDGVEASSGPDLALSHETVVNGLRGLPDTFRRLPELEALLP